ncbi:MAG: filamentous hemagglutinin N-terminal domain-containing protein [Desulfuromonadaceae bacterium]
MNKAYRLIWSKAKERWVIAAEIIKGNGGPSPVTVAAAVVTSLIMAASGAHALPVGGQVTAGQAAISTPSATQMNITQGTNQAIINWNSFGIGRGEAVNIVQPSSQSTLLNRVLGNNPSNIFGSLTANGRVFLTNPSGILFAPGASVNVGGLVASSLSIKDSDFLAGKYSFFKDGSGGSVVNQGNISGGFVALLGNSVENAGTIVTTKGTTGLAAGDGITLGFDPNGLMAIKVDKAAYNAQVTNNGVIEADGGTVVMTASAADALLATVVNNSGTIRARSMVERNGEIVIEGGASGVVQNSGTLDVSSATGSGGSIKVLGEYVALTGSALLDASGATGGGTVNVGGGFQGKDATLYNAAQTIVGSEVVIKADAVDSGNGGNVVVWSDKHTGFGGSISAKGGAVAGDGGAVEVSSKGQLNFVGMVDAGAANGAAGTLLLDPKNITVSTTGPTTADLTTVDQFVDGTGVDSVIAPTTITAVTNTGTAVTLQASNDITVNSLINTINSNPAANGGNGGNLTLEAGRSITNNSIIITDNGNLTLIANSSKVGVVDVDRTDGVADLINYGVINAGTGTVTMTIENGGTTRTGDKILSGSIGSGAVVASALNIIHNGPTAGGTIDIGSTTVKNMTVTSSLGRNVTNDSGGISVQGSSTSTATFDVGAGTVTLTGDSTDLEIIKVTNAGNVTLVDLNGLQLGASNITGFLDVTTHGPIGNTGAVTVGGQMTLNALTGGFGVEPNGITLDNGGNNFNTVWIKKGEAVTIHDSNGFTLSGGTNTVDNNLTLEAITGAITVSAATNVSAYTDIRANGASGSVTINSPVGTGSGMTIESSGNVQINNTLTAGQGLTISTTAGDITSTASGVLQAGYDITLNAQGATNGISLGANVTTTQESIIATTNKAFATTADLFAEAGYGSPTYSQGKVTVTATGGGASFKNVSVDQEFSVTAAGDITGTGVVAIANDSGFSGLSAAGYDITFANTGNNFRNVYIPAARNVTLKDQNASLDYGGTAIFFTGITASGNLDVTAGGSIASGSGSNRDRQHPSGPFYSSYPGNGVITVGGTSLFTVTAADSNLLLGNSANVFTGAVTMATSGAEASYYDLDFSNNTPVAAVIGGFPAASLHNVTLTFASAPSFEIPTMSLTGNLTVSLPTATIGSGLTQHSDGIHQSAGQTVAVSTSAAGNITIDSTSNSFSNLNITAANNALVKNSTDLNLVGIDTSAASGNGDFTLTNTGDVTQSGYVKVKGTASYDLGATHNLTLDRTPDAWGSGGNDQNILKVISANNVLVKEANDLTLDSSTISGTLALTGYNSSLDQVAASTVLVTGTTTFSTFSGSSGIDLTSVNNQFGPLAIANSGNRKVYITENDAITQASAWSLAGSNIRLRTVADQAITLDKDNSIAVLTLTQSGDGTAAGDVLVNSPTGYSLGQGAAWTTHGQTTITLMNGAWVNLNSYNDNILGPLQINNGTGYTNINAKDWADSGAGVHAAISDNAATGKNWTTTGVATLRAFDSTATNLTGTINLTNQSNVLGDLDIQAGIVTITEGHSITDRGNNSDATGAWITTGATTLNANNAVTLDNLSNSLGGLSVTVTGGAAVQITDNTDLTQSAAWHVGASPVTLNSVGHGIDLSTSTGNILGNINITTTYGRPTSVKIKEDDAITQGSTWDLTSKPVTLIAENDKSITLTDTANQMGNLTITGGAVTITENAAIVQGATADDKWTTTGTTTLNALQNAITLENTGNVLGAIAITVADGTPASLNITEDHDITQASAWILPTKAITLNSQTQDVVLGTAGNQLGALTVSGANASITENHAITNGDAWTVTGLTTLNATGNTISLENSLNNFGSLKIDSAGSDASVRDANLIELNDIAVSNMTLTSGGAISQANGTAVTAGTLRLLGSGSASLTNSGNNVTTFAASFSGGDLSYTDSNDFTVGNVNGTSGISVGINNVTLTSDTGTIAGLSTVASTSGSLTVQTATGLTLQAMTIGGAQTYTAGGSGITLNAGISSDQSGVITFSSPVTLGADLTIQSHDSAINFNGAITGATKRLTVNAGTGAIDFKEALSGLGLSSTASTALDVTASNTHFHKTLEANNGLSISGPVTFFDNITLHDGNAGSVFSGMVTFSNAGVTAFSGYDGVSFNNGVTLSGDTSITSNDSTLTFANAAIAGTYDLTLNSGTGTIVGLDKVGSNLTSLDVTGYNLIIPTGGATLSGPQTYAATGGTSVRLDGNVTSTLNATGAITFNSPVTLGNNVTVSTANSVINFNGTVDGARNLTVNSGTATTAFTGMIGTNNPLGSGTGAALVQNGSGATTFAETVETRSGIVAAGPVTFRKDTTLGDGDTGSTFTGEVTLDKAGTITLSGYDGIVFDGGINLLQGDADITSNNSLMNFSGAPGNVIGNHLLTLNAGTGTIGGTQGLAAMSSDLTGLTVTAKNPLIPTAGVTIDGNQNYTATDNSSITLEGNVSSTSNGTITFNNPVLLAADSLVQTTNGDITFASTIDGAHNLTVEAAGGATALFQGKIGSNSVAGSGTGYALDLQGSSNVLEETVQTASGIYVQTDAAFKKNVTLGDGDTGTLFNGTVTFDSTAGMTFSGYDGMEFRGDVTLANGSLAITSNSVDPVIFRNRINGAQALTIGNPGITTFRGTVGNSTPLASLTIQAGGTTELDIFTGGAAITTSGAQTFNNAVTLLEDTTLAGSLVAFNDTLDGGFDLSITGNARFGDSAGTDSVGGTDELASIEVSGTTSIGAALTGINTREAQTYTGAVTLGDGNHVFDSSDGFTIWFKNTIDGVNVGQAGLTVNTNSTTTFAGAIGAGQGLASLVTNVGGTTQINGGAVTTTGAQTYNDNVTLGADTTLTGSTMTTNGRITGNSRNLNVIANAVFGDGTGDWITGLTSLDVSGTTAINTDAVTTTGSQTYNGTVTLGTGTTLTGSTITTKGTVTGNTYSLNVSGDAVFGDEAADRITGLSSLDVTGATILNTDTVTTANGQYYYNAVTLGADTTLTGVDVSFYSTVTSDGTSRALNVNASGVTTFGGAVGSAVAGEKLSSLTTDAGGTTALNGAAVTTIGAQTYNDAVILGADTTLAGAGITLTATVVSDGTNRALAVNDSATTTFGGAVGSAVAGEKLSSLTTDAGGTTVLNGGAITTTGAQTYNDAVTLGAAATLTGVGNRFVDTVNGAHALTINDSGTTTFSGAVGGVTALTSLATDAGGTTAINGGSMETSGAQTYSDAVTLGANAVITSGSNAAFGTIDNNYNLTVNAAGQTTFGGIIGGVNPLSAISTDAAGTVLINTTDITTNGSQTFRDAMTLGADLSLNSSNGVTINNTISGAQSLVIAGGNGGVTLMGAVGGTTPLTALTVNNNAALSLAAVNTSGAQVYNSVSTITLNDSLSGTGLTFNDPVDVTATGKTLNAGTGNLTFGDTVNAHAHNLTLSTTGGTASQAAAITAGGLELLGAGGTFTLDTVSNDVGQLAGNTGTVRFRNDNGFAIGTINSAGLTTSGTLVLDSTGTVSQSANISAAGLALKGAGGTFTLTRDTNSIATLAADTGSIDLHNNRALTIGTVNPTGVTTTGNFTLKNNGAITQDAGASLNVGGNATLETTHAAGDVAINNSSAVATEIGATLVGGNYSLTATGKNVTQADGASLQVAGDLDVTAADVSLAASGNLVGGSITTTGLRIIRQGGGNYAW